MVNFQYDFHTDTMIEKKEFDNYALCIVLARNNDCDRNIELCKRYRELTDKPLLVFGESDTKMAVDFLKSGADDYIRIPIPKNAFETLLYAHYRRECRKNDNNMVKAMNRILLIEDDTNFVYIMMTIIETKNRKLFAVSNVENAINILRKNNNTIDLSLTDYNLRCNNTCMPIFDYLQGLNLDIPVIVLSANEYEDYADKVKNAGALACYDKTSLSISKIREIISDILK